MQVWASLWSADQLDLGRAVDRLDGHVDGFHVDVMDGHLVDHLLYGPDVVHALRQRVRTSLIDVHLMVRDAEQWLERCALAGADVITVHPESCADVRATLESIQQRGARPGVALSLDVPVQETSDFLERVDRVLLMGTQIGVKGSGLDGATRERLDSLVKLRDRSRRRPEIVVDGGIRRETVHELAQGGADGVVPGSLVFASEDWIGTVGWLQTLSRRSG